MPLKATVTWLLTIGHLAQAFYREVEEGFKEDKKFSQFFRFLSNEEAWHAEAMERASEH